LEVGLAAVAVAAAAPRATEPAGLRLWMIKPGRAQRWSLVRWGAAGRSARRAAGVARAKFLRQGVVPDSNSALVGRGLHEVAELILESLTEMWEVDGDRGLSIDGRPAEGAQFKWQTVGRLNRNKAN
jgi:hypothetical protein